MSPPRFRRDGELNTAAALIGETSRSIMLSALLGGESRSSSELARLAGISLPTASSHLGRLVRGRLVTVTIRARTRYYELAGRHVASVLESLAALAPSVGGPPRGDATRALHAARMCYDHLAGKLGVAIGEAMIARRLVRERAGDLRVAPAGEAWLRGLGVPFDELACARRPLIRSCLDWSERRPHIAGAVGAALARHALAEGWAMRLRETRALRVTERGRAELERLLGVHAET